MSKRRIINVQYIKCYSCMACSVWHVEKVVCFPPGVELKMIFNQPVLNTTKSIKLSPRETQGVPGRDFSVMISCETRADPPRNPG